ncbi:MAG: heme o synthase [Leptospiraceae bacterium]|nr:heme o synthase [Leptospiraceae bacterium]
MKKSLSAWNKLIKPRVSILVLVTVLPGLYLGTDSGFDWKIFTISMIGTFLMSSASFMLNQYIERELDSKMERTKNRPLPQGDIKPLTALLTAMLFIIVSFYILYAFINLLTAAVTLSGLLFYIFIYTILLKPRTQYNIVIGGAAGSIGPLIGYAASSNSLPVPAWVLFAMIFFWTPPHFWALAIFLKEDYSAAHFPMKPIVSGIEKTTRSIFHYTIIYALFCIGFYFSDPKIGLVYLIPTIALSIWIIYLSINLKRQQSVPLAKKFFFISIVHLFVINILIVIDYSVV